MSLEEEKLQENEGVRGLLKEDHKEELGRILAFGEKFKEEGEKMKEEYWKRGTSRKYVNLLLQYEYSKKEYIENLTEEEKEILDKLDGVGKDKFIEEYMHNKILYSGNADKEMERKEYGYQDWKAGKVVMKEGMIWGFAGYNLGDSGAEEISKMELKEGVILSLWGNQIGDEGAEAISNMKLEEGVRLVLGGNGIGDAGAKALSKMELKEGVELNLRQNHIGDEGAEAISKMKLKEGVTLSLGRNDIGDAGAEAIMKNMELKKGVMLDLRFNNISKEMKNKLRKWGKGYKRKGINCEVIVD